MPALSSPDCPLPCFFHLVMFCTHNLPSYEYQGSHNTPSSMLHTPSTCHMTKTCQGEKKWGKGQTKGKNCSSTLVLTAVTTMGKYNVMVFGDVHILVVPIHSLGPLIHRKPKTWTRGVQSVSGHHRSFLRKRWIEPGLTREKKAIMCTYDVGLILLGCF